MVMRPFPENPLRTVLGENSEAESMRPFSRCQPHRFWVSARGHGATVCRVGLVKSTPGFAGGLEDIRDFLQLAHHFIQDHIVLHAGHDLDRDPSP